MSRNRRAHLIRPLLAVGCALGVGCAGGPPPVLDSGLEPTLSLASLSEDEGKALCESSVTYAVEVISPQLVREATCRESAMLVQLSEPGELAADACREAYDSCLNLSSGNASKAGSEPCDVNLDLAMCEVMVEEAERCLQAGVDQLVAILDAQARWRCGASEPWPEKVDMGWTVEDPDPCSTLRAACPGFFGLASGG